MKHNLILLTVFLFAIACSKTLSSDGDITPATALQTKSLCSSNSRYAISDKEAERFIKISFPEHAIKNSYSICDGQDSIISIINLDEGWVAISRDKRVEPILCYDKSGQLTEDELMSHNGIKTWFNILKEDIIKFKESPSTQENENISFWGKFNNESTSKPATKAEGDEPVWAVFIDNTELSYIETIAIVPHLLSTKWGNWSPWNYKCPKDYNTQFVLSRCPTGCTGVAMAQMLYYLHYQIGFPSGLYHNITCTGDCVPSYTFSLARSNYVSNSSRWDNMKLFKNSSVGDSNYVGDLIMDVSDRVGMIYSYSGSGAFPSITGFNYYGVTCNTGSYSSTIVKNNLLSGKPVLIYANTVGNTSAHTWVIDGLTRIVYH